MRRSTDTPWLSRFAALTALSALGLISLGGLVTSHEAGLAVPDWPTTYGYNMFFFPISKWTGGIFYEHTHRLAASGVGLLTVVLAIWCWLKEARRWVRGLAWLAVVLVVFQGLMGGLRVVALKDEIGIFHAVLAQLFLVLIASLAVATSRGWQRAQTPEPSHVLAGLRRRYLILTGIVLVQLTLGATMRHQHAGLAIPDFPTAYGKIWPDTDDASIQRYNQSRGEVMGLKPITATQVWLQMAHRVMALGIVVAGLAAARRTLRFCVSRGILARLSVFLVGLILIQFGLGAATVWTDKSAEFATAHVAVGALSLVVCSVLALLAHRLHQLARSANSPACAASPVHLFDSSPQQPLP